MANINKINKDYEEILSGLTFEEIVAYYRNINKKMLETYPTLTSNKWNIEDHNKLFDSVEEATEIFKAKYPLISIVKYATIFEELENKYLEEHDLAVYKLLATNIVDLSSSIGLLVNSIVHDLTSIYTYYDYVKHIGTYALKYELDVPEELLEPLEPYFNNSSSFYGAKALSYFNHNIQVNFKILEMYIEAFNNNRRINFNAEELPEDLVEVLTMFNKAYDSGIASIKTFKELKEEPFKKAIEFEYSVRTKTNPDYTEEDKEKFIESKLASAPKYNFETFELILPTIEENESEGSVN